MEITDTARLNVRKYLGDETGAFLSKTDALLKRYAEEWKLSRLDYMPTNTVNLLFDCDSAYYGRCVLKACIPGPEIATEINCLRAYNGRGYVKLWNYDLPGGLLLLERVTPGCQMWEVPDYRERARLMAERVKDLPIPWDGQGEYPTYRSWMLKLRDNLIHMGGMADALFYLDEAMRAYDGLKRKYTRNCLLHGDLHQENMLLNPQGGYTVIDPKGVVDDPVMETARFLNNETPCEGTKILDIAAVMAPIIGIPEGDILKSMFVDTALGNCWSLEEHFETREAFEAQMQNTLDYCAFAYGLVKQAAREL